MASIVEPVDFEQVLVEALINEGAHVKILNTSRPQYFYSEKQLRDEAAAEVAQQQGAITDDGFMSAGGASGSRKRKNLNPDEKLKRSRDRNREHAKNTRLRKKAYVLKLKGLVEKMLQQKDLEETERAAIGMRIYETQNARKNAVRLFLNYRASNVRDFDKWSAILNESFQLKIPITPFRSFHKGNIVDNSRIVTGIDGVIADSASLFLMAQGVGFGSPGWFSAIKHGQGCYIVHSYGPDDIIVSGEQVMCHFNLRIEGGDKVEAKHRCLQHCMIHAKFDQDDKILNAEIVYDVMGFMQQLQKASSVSPESSIIPNTIDMALTPTNEPRAVMLAVYPYKIAFINEAWTTQNVTAQSFVEGKAFCEELGTSQSQRNTVLQLAADCSNGRPGSAVVMALSDQLTEKPVLIYLRMYPLTSDIDGEPKITHIMAVQTNLPLFSTEAEAVSKYLENEIA